MRSGLRPPPASRLCQTLGAMKRIFVAFLGGGEPHFLGNERIGNERPD